MKQSLHQQAFQQESWPWPLPLSEYDKEQACPHCASDGRCAHLHRRSTTYLQRHTPHHAAGNIPAWDDLLGLVPFRLASHHVRGSPLVCTTLWAQQQCALRWRLLSLSCEGGATA